MQSCGHTMTMPQSHFLTLTSCRFWVPESLSRKTFTTCVCHDGINAVIQGLSRITELLRCPSLPRGGALDADTGEILLYIWRWLYVERYKTICVRISSLYVVDHLFCWNDTKDLITLVSHSEMTDLV